MMTRKRLGDLSLLLWALTVLTSLQPEAMSTASLSSVTVVEKSPLGVLRGRTDLLPSGRKDTSTHKTPLSGMVGGDNIVKTTLGFVSSVEGASEKTRAGNKGGIMEGGFRLAQEGARGAGLRLRGGMAGTKSTTPSA